MHNYFWGWLGGINLLSALLFAYDKSAARNSRRRIPERTLHLLELAGGVFANTLLMYLLHHKNRKISYWVWTWGMAVLWIAILLYLEPFGKMHI